MSSPGGALPVRACHTVLCEESPAAASSGVWTSASRVDTKSCDAEAREARSGTGVAASGPRPDRRSAKLLMVEAGANAEAAPSRLSGVAPGALAVIAVLAVLAGRDDPGPLVGPDVDDDPVDDDPVDDDPVDDDPDPVGAGPEVDAERATATGRGPAAAGSAPMAAAAAGDEPATLPTDAESWLLTWGATWVTRLGNGWGTAGGAGIAGTLAGPAWGATWVTRLGNGWGTAGGAWLAGMATGAVGTGNGGVDTPAPVGAGTAGMPVVGTGGVTPTGKAEAGPAIHSTAAVEPTTTPARRRARLEVTLCDKVLLLPVAKVASQPVPARCGPDTTKP